MSKRKNKANENPWAAIRNDWGQVKPYTRIHQDKRKKKPKHKKKEEANGE